MLRHRLLSAVITSALACPIAAAPLPAAAQQTSPSSTTDTPMTTAPAETSSPQVNGKKDGAAWPAGQGAAAQQPVQSIMLDPLTVTATKAPAPRDSVPAAIDVITQDEIDRKAKEAEAKQAALAAFDTAIRQSTA